MSQAHGIAQESRGGTSLHTASTSLHTTPRLGRFSPVWVQWRKAAPCTQPDLRCMGGGMRNRPSTTLTLPAELLAQLDAYCAATCRTRSQAVELAIRALLEAEAAR